MEKKFIQYLLVSLIILFFNGISSSENQIPTEVFGSPPLVSSVKISPSGKKLAMYVTLKNGDSAILVRELTKKEPLRPVVTSDNKSLKLLGFNWFNDETILASAWLAEDYYQTKLDNVRLLRVKVDGSGFKPLFKKRHFKDMPFIPPQQSIIDYLSDDDEHVLVRVRTSSYRYPDVVKLNVDKNSIDILQKAKTQVVSWMTDQEGRVRIGRKYDRDAEISGSIIFKDLKTKKSRF